MKEFFKSFFARLTSRKFLLTVAAALVLVANEQWTELVILIGGYMGIEGLGDAADRVAAQKTEQVKLVQAQQTIERENLFTEEEPEFTGVIQPGQDKSTTTPPNVYGGDAPL